MNSIQLRPYQLDVVNALNDCGDNVVVVQPTGTGKTVEFAYYCIKNRGRTLILVNSEELIHQAMDTFKKIDPNVSIGRFIGKERDLDSQIIIASVQTLKNINNLMLIDRNFTNIIYDEAHHATSRTSTRILYAFGMCELDTAGHENVMFIEPDFNKNRKLIGFTATPERSDDIPIGNIFTERIDTPNLEWFIEEGYLCDLKFISIDTGIDMSDVRSYMGDLSESQMAKKLIESGYINELSRVINEYFYDCKSILLYVPNVATARMASQLINEAGIPSDYVVGSERDRRNHVIDRFKSGDIRVLANCLVLKEGFDAPNTDAIILCRPTKSKLLLKQIIGRGTRNSPNKVICKIGDLGVRRRQNDIITASGVFDDLELSPLEQKTMTIKDKIKVQKQKSGLIAGFVKILDDIRILKGVEEIENKKKRTSQEQDYDYEYMQDSVNLLLDTRILRAMGLDAISFHDEFTREKEKLEVAKPFENGDKLYDYQLEYLKKETGYTDDDLSMLKPVEAQSFMNIIKRQIKPTSQGTIKILENVYKVPTHNIPDRDVDARRIVKQLSQARLKYGRA